MEETKIKKRNRIAWPQERILGFTDGVFAFAITLLVLNLIDIPVPSGTQSLVPLFRDNAATFISFALTFFIIARFWMSHTRLFAIIKSYDTTMVKLNNAMLFFVTTFPFVASVLGTHMYYTDAVVMSAGCFSAIGILQYLIGRHAYKKQLFISDYLNNNFIRIFSFFSLSTPIVFIISIPVAFISPLSAELLWVILLFLRFGFRRYYKKDASDEIEIDEL
jgi:uncharacterized membrane protein